MTASQKLALEREIIIHSAMDHPNIVRVKAVYMAEGTVHLTLERLRGGSLYERMVEHGTLCEAEAARAVMQLLSALEHVHSRNVMHADVKVEHLMYVGGHGNASHLKLIDFGLATSCSRSHRSYYGTPLYAAPETSTGRYGSKADMWSAGIVTLVLLTRHIVCSRSGRFHISRQLSKLSPEAQDFVHALLQVDPASRFSATRALAHPWLMSQVPSTLPDPLYTIDEYTSTALASEFSMPSEMLTNSASSSESPRTAWKKPASWFKSMKMSIATRASWKSWKTPRIGAEVQVMPSHVGYTGIVPPCSAICEVLE
mmetsp:Transcript_27027/g.68750  ORF Transcript_27027/g.68750 Transcript_27027/m.68750 type:complete len:313 (+) Transcript_27027:214-1152(+)